MKKGAKKKHSISLQKWVKVHESNDPAKFVLHGKNKTIQTDKQVLQKFHKMYSLIY